MLIAPEISVANKLGGKLASFDSPLNFPIQQNTAR